MFAAGLAEADRVEVHVTADEAGDDYVAHYSWWLGE